MPHWRCGCARHTRCILSAEGLASRIRDGRCPEETLDHYPPYPLVAFLRCVICVRKWTQTRHGPAIGHSAIGADLPDGQFCAHRVQPLPQKYSSSPHTQITSKSPAVPHPIKRGVSRSSRTLGAGCGGRGSVRREVFRADGWRCSGRRSRVVLAPRRRRQVCDRR